LDQAALPDNAAGCTYKDLDEDLQHRFLDYALSVDLFIGATKEDIREVFRRMNSYTVPLNAEEKRHSRFQGEFKWFIYRLTKKYSQTFENIGTFTEKQLNRMQDAKLLSEIVYAILRGISTTKDAQLTKLYGEFDKKLPTATAVDIRKRLAKAVDTVLDYEELHGGALMKPYQLYALILAIMHSTATLAPLENEYSFSKKKSSKNVILANLTRLGAALDDPESEPLLAAFVDAGSEKTNVGDQRRTRFVWFCRAINDDMP
jgi:hypothetical protein